MKTGLKRTGIRTITLNTMQRLVITAIMAVGLMFLASTPSWAKPVPAKGNQHGNWPGEGSWGSVQLMNTGVEPRATGTASLTKVKYVPEMSDDWHWVYLGHLSVTCKNLTPGATYSAGAVTFTADRKGAGQADSIVFCSAYYDSWLGELIFRPCEVEVVRLNSDGSSTTVLSGFLLPPGYEYVFADENP